MPQSVDSSSMVEEKGRGIFVIFLVKKVRNFLDDLAINFLDVVSTRFSL